MTLRPQAEIGDEERERGLRILTGQAAFSTFSDSMMGGVILTAFALSLGANDATIGAIAAVSFWNQLLQAPGLVLIERLRMRKLIAVAGCLTSALAPAALAALAFTAASPGARAELIAAVALYGGAGAVGGCAWNAWVRDVVPGEARGRFFGRRSTLSTLVSMAAGLLAAWLLDLAPAGAGGRAPVFAGLFALAFLSQATGAVVLAQAPEPQMPPATSRKRLWQLLRTPLADADFRRLIAFLASWQFAVNLAQPFFTVFFLRQLGFDMKFVMALSLVSQLANVLTLSRWGGLADIFGSKAVLSLAAPAFVLCIAGMIIASQIESRLLAGAYLVVLHLVMGAAAAGVSLASGAIAMKMSPHGRADAYLAANALICAAAGGLAPILGGYGADFFAARRFSLALEWRGPHFNGALFSLSIHQWDFYFLISALLGLYALHRLALAPDPGHTEGRELLHELLAHAHAAERRIMPVAGLNAMNALPAGLLAKGANGSEPAASSRSR